MILIKVGGGKNINWDYIAKDLGSIKENVIIIHGANGFMSDISEKLGIAEKMIISPSGHTSRYTDGKTMELLTMIYSGLLNKKIIACLQKSGTNAIGLSGADGKLWLGVRKTAIYAKEGEKIKIIKDSLTGTVQSINVSLINVLVKSGFVPVITIPAITDDGQLINVDNDRAAAVMVRDLHITTLIMLFEAPGLLEDPEDEKTKIDKLPAEQLDHYIAHTTGRMRKKLLGVKEAFSYGVETVYFGDGRISQSISKALKGEGTTIY